jgi:sialate O-acetylesterase
MKMTLLPCLILFSTLALHAAPVLHPLFSDRAVLQRDVVLPVFGTANRGENIAVTLGDRTAKTKADDKGLWRVEFPPAPASAAGMMLEARGEDGQPARATDILLGDVWLLGGQSNMRHAFRTYPLLKDSTAQINDPDLRLLVINAPAKPSDQKAGPAESSPSGPPSLIHAGYKGAWQSASQPYIDEFSPVGYYFGAALRRELKVPVGLVLSTVGGTQLERWLPAADAEKVKPGAFFSGTPSDLYDKMIAPLRGFAWRGVAWYQGESNSNDPLSYGPLLKSLIDSWRRELGVAGRPFLIVQIAPFVGGPGQIKPESWAWLREQQSQAAGMTRNAGLVVTLDVGEAEDIHPQNKVPVGERLALWALQDAGRKVQAAGPRFLRQDIKGPVICLTFSETAGGLKTQRLALNRKRNLPFGTDPEAAVAPADQLTGFQICGADGVFYPAEGSLKGDQVSLRSSSVPSPTAARYAWENFPLGNLFGGSGLPAEPFRTDKFPSPDFGLPIDGHPAPAELPGVELTLLKTGHENPYGPATTVEGREAQAVLHADKPAVKFEGRYVYAALSGEFSKADKPVIISIIYHDDFPSVVKVRYDSSDNTVNPQSKNPGVFKEAGSFRTTGAGAWKIVEFQIADGHFERRCNGADIRLESTRDRNLVIGGIYARPVE